MSPVPLGESIGDGLRRYRFAPSAPARLVLLVEDDQRDRELTLEGLKLVELAADVVVAADGEAALRYLREAAAELPDYVLLDLKMPRIDGLEVLRTIRTDQALRQLKVVILTASSEPSDRDCAHALGCDAYLVKPPGLIGYMRAVQEVGRDLLFR